MALVDDHDAVAAQVREDGLGLRYGNDFSDQAMAVRVTLPHPHEIFRTKNERLQRVRWVLENPRERGGHDGFAETDDIAENHSAALLEMAGGNAHGGGLELQQGAAHIGGNGEFGEPRTRFLGEVVGHLHVNPIGRKHVGPRPALIDDLDQFTRDIDAPAVVPTLVEPARELFGRVVIEHIDVQLALSAEAGEREIAAAEEPDDGVDGVAAETEVEFRVEGVSQEKLYDHLAGLELGRKSAQAGFICVGGCAERKLIPEILSQAAFQLNGGLHAHLALLWRQAVGVAQLVLRESLHADE